MTWSEFIGSPALVAVAAVVALVWARLAWALIRTVVDDDDDDGRPES